MKITIEPTGNPENYPTVSISVEGNDMTIDQMIDDLIRPALLACGFQPETLAAAFDVIPTDNP